MRAMASRGLPAIPSGKSTCRSTGDAGLEVRIPVEAGPRVVGVSFVRELWEPEGLPQPLQRGRVIANDQVYMDYANVASVQIGGPYEAPARREGHAEPPRDLRLPAEGRAPTRARCATKILSRMARLAYRRPVTKADMQTLLDFFGDGRRDGGSFDAGIQFALERMLVDPDFLLRVHRDSAAQSPKSGRAAGRRQDAYRLSDLELASRLSFFLWSSIPDERLLDARGARPADESRDARKRSAAHAGRSARDRARSSTTSPRSG